MATKGRITQARIDAMEYVPNPKIRQLVLDRKVRDKFTWAELCIWLDEVGSNGIADTSGLKRKLGIDRQSGSKGKPGPYTQYIDYHLAVKIVRYFDKYPLDYDL